MSQIAPDMLADDIACRRCGYNLRGLDETGRCPECGTPVGLSIKGDLLRFADPVWLRKLNIGLRLMFWGAVCYTVFRSLSLVLLWLFVPGVGTPIIYFAVGLISAVGIWLLTEPDPAGLSEVQYLTSRKLIRITLIIGLVWRCFGVSTMSQAFSPDARLVITIVGAIAGIAFVIGEIAIFKYLGKIAGRIPNDSFAWWSRLLMWGYAIIHGLLVLLIPTFSILFSMARPTMASWGSMYAWAAQLLSFAYLIVIIIAAILYRRFTRVVCEQRIAALATWAAMTDTKGEVSA